MYEAYYNLSKKPFHLNPDPKFFFESQGHKRAMSYLRYGLMQNEGFIIITGGIGTGKTTLVRLLFEQLTQENIITAQLVTTHLEKDELLRMIAASFGLAHENTNKATILKNLEIFFVTRAKEGKKALLVIDEAQNLPIDSLEELRMLSNFQVGGRTLLQTFLLGQSEFKETLKSNRLEQLKQRVLAAYHLEPLAANETTLYIKHRLTQAGWAQNPKFTDRAFSAIFQNTSGVPRKINKFCDRLMLFGCLEELDTFDAEHVELVANELQLEINPNENEIEQNSLTPSTPPFIASPSHEEAKHVGGLEQRVQILEERIDILERAFRRQLDTKRK